MIQPVTRASIAEHSTRRLGRKTFDIFCATTMRALRMLVNFWNIPVLGADETGESRYYRTKHF
jgi:hypothetical protein